jgi:CheY-like chemotaxis protein
MMEDRRRYLDVGMNDCLVKPFTKQQLFDVLATQLASNGSAGRRATQR